MSEVREEKRFTGQQSGQGMRMDPDPRPGGGPGGGFALGMPMQKPKNFKGTLQRFIGYFKPYTYLLIIVFIAAAVSVVFTTVSPKIMGLATTSLFESMVQKTRGVPGAGINFNYIVNILLILAVLYTISAIANYVQQYIMASVSQKLVYNLREEVEDKLSRLPLKFFDSRTHGEILSRAVNDMDNISTTLQQSLTQLVTSVVTLIGVIAMMLSINLILTIVVLLTLPLSLLVTTVIAKRSQTYFKEQQNVLGNLNGHVEEMYTGHKIVKAFGLERKSITEFNTINERLFQAGWKAQFVSTTIMPLMMFVGNVGYVLVSIIGGILVTQRAIAIGDVQAFIQYARQFNQPITQLANFANIIQSTIASAERIFELLDEQEEVPEAANAKVIQSPRGEVQFQHVKFRYKKDVPLIEDLNITVKPGQTIAIVGPTGAGKTTLVNLLLRFYELEGGKILIDGVDITQLKRSDLRSMFGMVLQDTWLFKGTIRDNIAYGREGATEEEIIRAAKAAHADHFIRTLPDGYNTILNQEATNISQGQKQLLTIARTILTDPAILILDEATSSVDTRTEVYIQKAMGDLMKGRTSFVIAHRLSTIRDADLILVMNHGDIIEQGTHEQLLAQRGFYADLYNSQFTRGTSLEEAV